MGTTLCKNTTVKDVAVEKVAVDAEHNVRMACNENGRNQLYAFPYAEQLNKSWLPFQAQVRGHFGRKRAEAHRVKKEAARLKVLRRIIFEQKIAILNELMLKIKVLGALAEYGDIPWDNCDIELCPCLLIGLLAIMN